MAPRVSAPLAAAVTEAVSASMLRLPWALASLMAVRDFSTPSLKAWFPAVANWSVLIMTVSSISFCDGRTRGPPRPPAVPQCKLLRSLLGISSPQTPYGEDRFRRQEFFVQCNMRPLRSPPVRGSGETSRPAAV